MNLIVFEFFLVSPLLLRFTNYIGESYCFAIFPVSPLLTFTITMVNVIVFPFFLVSSRLLTFTNYIGECYCFSFFPGFFNIILIFFFWINLYVRYLKNCQTDHFKTCTIVLSPRTASADTNIQDRASVLRS